MPEQRSTPRRRDGGVLGFIVDLTAASAGTVTLILWAPLGLATVILAAVRFGAPGFAWSGGALLAGFAGWMVAMSLEGRPRTPEEVQRVPRYTMLATAGSGCLLVLACTVLAILIAVRLIA